MGPRVSILGLVILAVMASLTTVGIRTAVFIPALGQAANNLVLALIGFGLFLALVGIFERANQKRP